MARLDRKQRPVSEYKLVWPATPPQIFDNNIKEAYRINDAEYDYLCEHMTDEEIDLFTSDDLDFSGKRRLINLLNKYVDEYRLTVLNASSN